MPYDVDGGGNAPEARRGLEITVHTEGIVTMSDGGLKSTVLIKNGDRLIVMSDKKGRIDSIESSARNQKTTYRYSESDTASSKALPNAVTVEDTLTGTTSYRFLYRSAHFAKDGRKTYIDGEDDEGDKWSFYGPRFGGDWTFWIGEFDLETTTKCDVGTCRDRFDMVGDALGLGCAALIESGPGVVACMAAMLYLKYRCHDSCDRRCK